MQYVMLVGRNLWTFSGAAIHLKQDYQLKIKSGVFFQSAAENLDGWVKP